MAQRRTWPVPTPNTLVQALPPLEPEPGGRARLRGRLLLVLVVGLLPLLGYLLVAAEATRHATLDWLETELHDAARQAAAREADELGRAAALLDAMAGVPVPAEGIAGLCAALRPRLAGGPPGIIGLAVHTADGRPACNAPTSSLDGDGSGAVPSDAAIGSAHVRGARAAPEMVTMTAGPTGLVLARGFGASAEGAVLALVLSPAHLPPLSLPLRRDHAIRLLVDPADGTVLAVQPGQAAPADAVLRAGAPLQMPRLLAALRSGNEAGVIVARDLDGTRRLIGHAALPSTNQHDAFSRFAGRAVLLMELPYDVLLDEADARRRDQWLAALAMALLGTAAAWVLAQRRLVAPISALLAVGSRALRLPGQAQSMAALRPAGEWLRQQGDLAAVAAAAGEMFLRLDGGLRVLYASPSTRTVLGYAPSEVIDADLAAEPGWEACREQVAQLRRGEVPEAPCRIVSRRRDDGEVRLEVRASRLADGGFMLVARDIGAEHALHEQLAGAQAQLAALGATDVESGLANLRRFENALAEEIRRARRAQEPLALVLVRLANATDAEAARRVGHILLATLRRPGELAARLETNLFAVLLPTTDRIGAQRLAERLHESVTQEQAAWTGACSVLPLTESDGPEAVLALSYAALRDAMKQNGPSVALAAPVTITSPVAVQMSERLAS